MSDGQVIISTELDTKPVEEGKKKIEKNLKKIDVSKLEKDLNNISKSFENTNKKIDLQEAKLEKLKESYDKATDVDKKNKIEEQMLNTESSIIKLNGQLDKLGDKMVDLDSKIQLGKAQQEIENTKIEVEVLEEEFKDLGEEVKKIEANTESLGESVKEVETPIEELSNSMEGVTNETAKLEEELEQLNGTTSKTATETTKVKTSLSEAEKEAIKLEKQMEKLKHTLGGEVPEATREAYTNIQKFNQEIRSTSRQFGSYSQETQKARNALNEYVLGLDDTTFKQVYMRGQLGLTDAQLTQQANSIKLNARMIKLMGTQTEHLTHQMEGLQSKGIKPKDMLPASTLGQFKMLNETISASGNPIYKLSAGYRALGTNIEQTIKGWSAQKMAVKLAGDDMVKYGLLLRGITAGQASLAMAFPIVGIAAVMAYGAMFKGAIQADEGLQKLAETAKSKLGQAFKPLLDVAGIVVKVFLDMTIKVADMMIKFNELHPIISKVVAAIGFLLPAMTLLLLPLNMGIGLLAGWKVAIAAAWTAIGGIASAVGLAASTFLAFAAVIGAVVGGLIYFYKTNETFRNTVNAAWDSISQKGKEVFGGLAKYFTETLPNAFKEGGFKGVLETIGNSISNIASTVATKAPELLKSGQEIIKNFLTGVQEKLPSILETGSQIITNIIQGLSNTLPQIIQRMNETRIMILETIREILPQLLELGVDIITMLIQGIADALPIVLDIGIKIITALLDAITENLPLIIDTAIEVIMTFINGLVDALPYIVSVGVDLILALVDALIDNLPTLIDSTVKIIDSLIDAVIEALPKIIEAAIKIVIALAEGLAKATPQLIAVIPKIFKAIQEGFMSADWGGLGTSILNKILEMLNPIIEPVMTFFGNLWTTISTFFTSTIPTFFTGLWTTVYQSFVTGWTNIVNFFTVSIPAWINAVGVWFSELPNKIAYALGYALATVIEWGVGIWLYLSENVPLWIEGVNTWFSELPDKVKTWFDNTTNNIKQWGIDVYTELSTSIMNMINSADSWFSELPNRVQTWFNNTLENIKQWGINTYNEISASIHRTIEGINQWFSEMPGKVKAWFDKVITDLIAWGTSLYTEATAAGKKFYDGVVEEVGKIPDKMREIGNQIVAGIKEGISSAWGGMTGWFGGLADSFIQGVKDKFEIHSPSRLMRDLIGKNIVKGIEVGMRVESPNLLNTADEEMTKLTSKLKATVDFETARTTARITANANKAAGTTNTTQTITNEHGINLNIETFNNNSNQDIEEISQELAFLGKRNPIS